MTRKLTLSTLLLLLSALAGWIPPSTLQSISDAADDTDSSLLAINPGHAKAVSTRAAATLPVTRYDPTFVARAQSRLPLYTDLFTQAAEDTGFDWRLLAALSYQESEWDPEAISHTGVQGLMMLTKDTAAYLGLDDRMDPEQSISGGARYLREIKDSLPKRIQEPDRTWMALAAYNIGPGHLEDARVLTANAGANANRWDDVKDYLPLLSDESYLPQLKYGTARGGEPVVFVRRIRQYFQAMVGDYAVDKYLVVTAANSASETIVPTMAPALIKPLHTQKL